MVNVSWVEIVANVSVSATSRLRFPTLTTTTTPELPLLPHSFLPLFTYWLPDVFRAVIPPLVILSISPLSHPLLSLSLSSDREINFYEQVHDFFYPIRDHRYKDQLNKSSELTHQPTGTVRGHLQPSPRVPEATQCACPLWCSAPRPIRWQALGQQHRRRRRWGNASSWRRPCGQTWTSLMTTMNFQAAPSEAGLIPRSLVRSTTMFLQRTRAGPHREDATVTSTQCCGKIWFWYFTKQTFIRTQNINWQELLNVVFQVCY